MPNKRLSLLFAILFVCALSARAQDRIVLNDGQEIKCKITSYQRPDGRVFYILSDATDVSQQFVETNTIEHIFIAGKMLIASETNARLSLQQFVEVNPKKSLTAYQMNNIYGIYGGYGKRHYTLSASYTHVFGQYHGLSVEATYLHDRVKYEGFWGFALIPSYELRGYVQSIGSFLRFQIGVGPYYFEYDQWIATINGVSHYTTKNHVHGVVNLKAGLDVRLRRGLYLALGGTYNWFLYTADINSEYYFTPLNAAFSLQAGLRFGREQK